MDSNTATVQKTSIFPDENIQHVKDEQPTASTFFLCAFLVVGMIVLKKFIYIKDPKRDGK